MSKILNEVLSANRDYVNDFGDKGDLSLPPARHFAILTCMDARLDPAKYAGLSEGDAHVIRNAGGRASDERHLCGEASRLHVLGGGSPISIGLSKVVDRAHQVSCVRGCATASLPKSPPPCSRRDWRCATRSSERCAAASSAIDLSDRLSIFPMGVTGRASRSTRTSGAL